MKFSFTAFIHISRIYNDSDDVHVHKGAEHNYIHKVEIVQWLSV